MTKRDFEVIADIIKLFPLKERVRVTSVFCIHLGVIYPNFDHSKFMNYILKPKVKK